MLLNKTTHCYRCSSGVLSRTIHEGELITHAIDLCNRCDAKKTTILIFNGKHDFYLRAKGDVCGSAKYA